MVCLATLEMLSEQQLIAEISYPGGDTLILSSVAVLPGLDETMLLITTWGGELLQYHYGQLLSLVNYQQNLPPIGTLIPLPPKQPGAPYQLISNGSANWQTSASEQALRLWEVDTASGTYTSSDIALHHNATDGYPLGTLKSTMTMPGPSGDPYLVAGTTNGWVTVTRLDSIIATPNGSTVELDYVQKISEPDLGTTYKLTDINALVPRGEYFLTTSENTEVCQVSFPTLEQANCFEPKANSLFGNNDLACFEDSEVCLTTNCAASTQDTNVSSFTPEQENSHGHWMLRSGQQEASTNNFAYQIKTWRDSVFVSTPGRSDCPPESPEQCSSNVWQCAHDSAGQLSECENVYSSDDTAAPAISLHSDSDNAADLYVASQSKLSLYRFFKLGDPLLDSKKAKLSSSQAGECDTKSDTFDFSAVEPRIYLLIGTCLLVTMAALIYCAKQKKSSRQNSVQQLTPTAQTS